VTPSNAAALGNDDRQASEASRLSSSAATVHGYGVKVPPQALQIALTADELPERWHE